MKLLHQIKRSLRDIAEGSAETSTGSGLQRQHAHEAEVENAILILATTALRLSGTCSSDQEEMLFLFLRENCSARNEKANQKKLREYLLQGAQPFVKIACEELKTLTTFSSRVTIMGFLLQLVTSENLLQEVVAKFLYKAALQLQLTESDWSQLMIALKPATPFTLLEMEETNSVQKVKAAYRKMVLKYHPDKTVYDQEAAAKKFIEITKAYETIIGQLSAT